MPIALEITLILVLIALAVGLVPLLNQLRRTARGLDLFLLSTKKDLAQIAEDVHATRVRMDHVAGSLEIQLGEFARFARSIGELGSTIQDWHTRFHNTIDSASRTFGGILGGISTVLAFCKSKQTPHEPE